MAVWPFILLRSKDYIQNQAILNHERIHLRQQLEGLLIGFYLIYALEYLMGRFSNLSHDAAYRNISYEREAYRYDQDPEYLSRRKPWNNFRKRTFG